MKLQKVYIDEPVFKTTTLLIWNCSSKELVLKENMTLLILIMNMYHMLMGQ